MIRLPVMTFVGSELLGQVEFIFDKPPTFGSLAIFCPQCGEIWARIFIPETPFHAVPFARCEKHRGGILVDALSREEWRYLPAAAWQREAFIIANSFEYWSADEELA